MKTHRIQAPLAWGAALFGVVSSFAEVGEFTISENLIRQMQVITQNTTPFTKKGRQINPNIQVQVTPQVKNNSNALTLGFQIDLSGTSRSRSYTPVKGNKGVTAVVDADINASYVQNLHFDGEQIKRGVFTGKTQINPKNISVSNNFGLLSRLVNKKAQQKARSQVQAELPQERRELEGRLQQDIQKGLEKASDYLKRSTEQIHNVFSTSKTLPFDSKLSSQTGLRGGVALRLFDKGDKVARGPKPEFENKDQIATSGVFHQDLLTETISKEIAGKEMKISELKAHLCSQSIKGLIDFCETDIATGSLGISVIFEKENPISFEFKDGKVSIEINAKARVGVKAGDQVPAPLFNFPDAEGLQSVDLEPFQAKITYAVQDDGAKLENLSVTSLPQVARDLPNQKPMESHGAGLSGVWGRVTGAAGALLSSATRSGVENEFKKLMREKIDFPVTSFPTKIKAKGENETPEILEAASLVPLEAKAENGWLAISGSFCSEKVNPLGVSFDKSLRISAVQPGSPAEAVGFKVGDRIDAYEGEGTRPTALVTQIDPFIHFVKDRAISKQPTQRKIQLKGKDTQGIPFERTVSLCPSQINHREEAQKLLNQSK